MKKNLKTQFSRRQYMLSKDFELYYYSDSHLGNVNSHMHDYYEFYFFLEGNVSILIQEQLYPLKTGDVVLIPPGVLHRAVIHDQDQPYSRFVFWISVEYFNRMKEISRDYSYLIDYAKEEKIHIFHNSIVEFSTIQSKIFQLIEEIHAQRFGREAKISICVSDLLLHLNRVVYERVHPGIKQGDKNLEQKMIQYIDSHLEQDLSLEQLAGKFYVSKYYIAHMFKETIGISIHQYITKKRLAACRDAILSNISISRSYLMFGFKDYSSFYRAFKKEYGISPKEFKDMQIQMKEGRKEFL